MLTIAKKRFVPEVIIVTAFLLLATNAIASELVHINGSGSGLHMIKPMIEAYTKAHPEVQFEIEKSLGSSGAIKALIAGVLDIAVSSRPLKPAEIKAGAVLEKYGQTPLALVTHPSVTQKEITTQELMDIYAGTTLNWPDGQRIRLILRPVEDSDTKLLRKLSPEMDLAMTSAQTREGMTIAVTDPEAIEAIAQTPGSLGASGLTGVIVEQLPVKVMNLNGVEPTPATLSSGSFPLAKPLDIVTITPKLTEAAKKFLAFIYSPDGKKIAVASGVQITASEKSPW